MSCYSFNYRTFKMNTSPTLNYAYHLTPERVEEIQTRYRKLLHEKYSNGYAWEIENFDQIPVFFKAAAVELEITEDEMFGYVLHIIVLYILELRRHFSIRPMDKDEMIGIVAHIVEKNPNASTLLFGGMFGDLKEIPLKELIDQHAKRAGISPHDAASALAGFMGSASELLVLLHDHG